MKKGYVLFCFVLFKKIVLVIVEHPHTQKERGGWKGQGGMEEGVGKEKKKKKYKESRHTPQTYHKKINSDSIIYLNVKHKNIEF